MENIGGILYDVSVAVLGIAYPLAIIIFILGAVIISFKGREDIGDFYDKKIRRASRDSERKKSSRDPNWKEKKADEKRLHLSGLFDDQTDHFGGSHDAHGGGGNKIG